MFARGSVPAGFEVMPEPAEPEPAAAPGDTGADPLWVRVRHPELGDRRVLAKDVDAVRAGGFLPVQPDPEPPPPASEPESPFSPAVEGAPKPKKRKG